MTPPEVAAILRQFNEWRRSDYEPSEQPEPPNPYEVGLAIDAAVEMLDEIDRLRTQNAVLMTAINTAPAACRTCGHFERRERGARDFRGHAMSITDHAHELRRYARKVGYPAGDVPSVMLAAADEIEFLRAQNAILTDAINAASQIMASAPAWHAMHREAIEQLQKVKKEMES